MTRYGILVGLAICAIAAWICGTYYYLAYLKEFARQRAMGGIPAHLVQGRRVDLVWMIASSGIVPNGEPHRKRSAFAFGLFVLCLVGMVIAVNV
jgi:hypothetical protein